MLDYSAKMWRCGRLGAYAITPSCHLNPFCRGFLFLGGFSCQRNNRKVTYGYRGVEFRDGGFVSRLLDLFILFYHYYLFIFTGGDKTRNWRLGVSSSSPLGGSVDLHFVFENHQIVKRAFLPSHLRVSGRLAASALGPDCFKTCWFLTAGNRGNMVISSVTRKLKKKEKRADSCAENAG